ncbi:MAG: hypothetical protein RR101_14115 [Burkholderiaceae bacterium]
MDSIPGSTARSPLLSPPALLEALGKLNWRSPANAIREVDARVRELFMNNPEFMFARMQDSDFAHGAPLLESIRVHALQGDMIGTVAWCFRHRLRDSLAYLIDTRKIPVDGAYFELSQQFRERPERACDTLLAACLRRLGTEFSHLAKEADVQGMHAPYEAIAIDLLARGASGDLKTVAGGDFAPRDLVVGEPTSALLRAWSAFRLQSEKMAISTSLLEALAHASPLKDRALLPFKLNIRSFHAGQIPTYREIFDRLGIDITACNPACGHERRPIEVAVGNRHAAATELLLGLGVPLIDRTVSVLADSDDLGFVEIDVVTAIPKFFPDRPDLAAAARANRMIEEFGNITRRPGALSL